MATANSGLGNSEIKDKHQVNGTMVSRSKRVARDRQAIMWDVTLDDNLRGCHRYPRSSEVSVSYNGEGASGSFVGLQDTHSRWASPLSALVIQHDMKIHLATGIKNHMRHRGGALLFLVNTVPHDRTQSLEELLNGLKAGMRAMMVGTKWAEDKVIFDITDYFSDYETTWGLATGWHPHKNTVMFLDKALSENELEALQAKLFGRYVQGVVKAGLKAPHYDHGLKIQQVTGWGADAATVAGYVSKGSMTLASEITGSATKTAASDRYTPGEMLDLLADQKAKTGEYDPATLRAYREYEAAFKDLRSSWSRGAKKRLGIDHLSDEDFLAMEDELFELANIESVERPDPAKRMVIAGIKREEWKKISANFQAREAIESACGLANTPEAAQALVGAVLDDLGVLWRPQMASMAEIDLDTVLPTHNEALSRDLSQAVWAGKEQRLIPMMEV